MLANPRAELPLAGRFRELVTNDVLWHSGGPIRRAGGPRDSRDLGFPRARGARRAENRLRACHRARFVTNLRLQSLARRLGPVCVNDGLTGECCLPSGWRAITEIGKQRGAGRLSESFSSLATRHFLFIVGGQGCNIFRFR